MKLTTLGGSGAWPTADRACSGYLVELEGFRVLIDPGYGTMPLVDVETLDAVLVTHGHPDHCADLNPLLRARVWGDTACPPLPVYAPPGALDAVLALDRPGAFTSGLVLHSMAPREPYRIGPFDLETWLLPHHRPNLGLRLSGGGKVLAYTGDTGPAPELWELARDADIYLAEATFPVEVPEENAGYLSSARQAGRDAARAGVGSLLLTHLQPGVSEEESIAAAAEGFDGPVAGGGAGRPAPPPRGK
ncbi:MBL fold metallo-hydrolase [Nonomuraea sp. NPDC050556]|uniref:MBL fold metallo-hydrolase n=1 Tax=Nonomuraea sp. NPDC050556 TaxID=3364369 RepID=UPI0037BD5AFB